LAASVVQAEVLVLVVAIIGTESVVAAETAFAAVVVVAAAAAAAAEPVVVEVAAKLENAAEYQGQMMIFHADEGSVRIANRESSLKKQHQK